MNIGINGFGRIGRMVLRAAIENDAEINAINDPNIPEPSYVAYLFKHDSTHGRYFGKICYDDKHLIINRMKIKLFREKDPKKVPWCQVGGEWVIESSGKFKDLSKAKAFLDAGVKKVIISAPSKDAPMYVCGVNLDKYDPSQKIVSMASCTTNCLAPLVKVLNDKYGIDEALMTTVHSVTNSQAIIDSINFKKIRLGRGGMQNIIPATTGAAHACGKILPELRGKITGMAFRVPTPNVSVVDLTVKLCNCTDYESIKCAVREAANCSMKGILGYTEEDVVSTDFLGCKCSSVFDAKAGIQLNDKFFKLICWYDNEVGYANRIIDFIKYLQDADCSPKPICGPILKKCPPPCPPPPPPCPPPPPPCPPPPCPPKSPTAAKCPPPCPPPFPPLSSSKCSSSTSFSGDKSRDNDKAVPPALEPKCKCP